MCLSVPQMAAPATRIKTSPGPGFGTGQSRTSVPSGPSRGADLTTANMFSESILTSEERKDLRSRRDDHNDQTAADAITGRWSGGREARTERSRSGRRRGSTPHPPSAPVRLRSASLRAGPSPLAEGRRALAPRLPRAPLAPRQRGEGAEGG